MVEILEILRKRSILSKTSLKSVHGFMTKWGVDAYNAVIETHSLDESRLSDLLADEFKFPRLSRLRSRTILQDSLGFLDYATAMSVTMIVFAVAPSGNLQVAVADPTRREGLQNLRAATGRDLEVFVSERTEIEAAIQRNYPLTLQLPSLTAINIDQTGGK